MIRSGWGHAARGYRPIPRKRCHFSNVEVPALQSGLHSLCGVDTPVNSRRSLLACYTGFLLFNASLCLSLPSTPPSKPKLTARIIPAIRSVTIAEPDDCVAWWLAKSGAAAFKARSTSSGGKVVPRRCAAWVSALMRCESSSSRPMPNTIQKMIVLVMPDQRPAQPPRQNEPPLYVVRKPASR